MVVEEREMGLWVLTFERDEERKEGFWGGGCHGVGEEEREKKVNFDCVW